MLVHALKHETLNPHNLCWLRFLLLEKFINLSIKFQIVLFNYFHPPLGIPVQYWVYVAHFALFVSKQAITLSIVSSEAKLS